MPKDSNVIQGVTPNYEDYPEEWESGYNQALSDCLEVCNKLLGDSNE